MDKINAINIMLQSIGEIPLDISDNQTLDDVLANSFEGRLVSETLEEVKREVLADGLHCNTDEDWVFQPDTNGYIAINKKILKIDTNSSQSSIIVRDWKLYDKTRKSFKFTGVVVCDVIWELNFDDLPHTVAYYVTIRATRKFQARAIGDQVAYAFSDQDEKEAYKKLKASEIREGNYNMFDDGISNRPISRSSNPTGIGR